MNYSIDLLSIIQLIATLGLVALTGWYAWHTKRMADVMAKNFEISISPMLDVLPGNARGSFPTYSTSINFRNIGRYVSYLRNITLILFMADYPEATSRKGLHHGEIELNPNSQPKNFPIRLDTEDISSLNMDPTPGRYSYGVHVKAKIEVEIAGPNKNYNKRFYPLF